MPFFVIDFVVNMQRNGFHSDSSYTYTLFFVLICPLSGPLSLEILSLFAFMSHTFHPPLRDSDRTSYL